ncbi:MAG: Acyl-phosphate:glycerol-3-phosphate O-acyltransferase PlsY [Dehalococcoidia bacterium]|nr:Acyl-phosphate:glycerol-3-phosphate O-acyltransferase PlsY [Dehalococcoidia bacterium]
MILDLLLSITGGYLLGSIPFPYLLGRLRGADLFKIGSRNPGAANLFRQVSKPLGVLATLLDIGKGSAAVLLGLWLGLPEVLTLLAGAAAMVGHWYSVFLKFRGGEALATVMGVGLGVMPLAALTAIAIGLILLRFIRSTGHAAGLAWPVFVAVSILEGAPWHVILGATALAIIVTLRSNLRARRARRSAP